MVLRCGEKRAATIRECIATRQIVATKSPVLLGTQRYTAVLPYALTLIEGTRHRLSFVPIWCLCYIGCHMRSSIIRVVVLEIEGGKKLEFTEVGWRSSNYTTRGPGVGEEAVQEAELALGKVVESGNAPEAVRSISKFFWQQIEKQKAA